MYEAVSNGPFKIHTLNNQLKTFHKIIQVVYGDVLLSDHGVLSYFYLPMCLMSLTNKSSSIITVTSVFQIHQKNVTNNEHYCLHYGYE